MSLSVLCDCPACKRAVEATGNWLQAVELDTRETWVVECMYCGEVFLYGTQRLE